MTRMNKSMMLDIFNSVMDSRTISMSPVAFHSEDTYFTRDNGAIIRVSPFDVEEFDEGDGVITWVQAERCIDVHLCYSLVLHYIEKVIIDYEHDDMYTEIEAVEAEAECLTY